MPYIFLSEEAIASLKDEISEQILDLEDQIWTKKAIWNDLDNKYEQIPQKVEQTTPKPELRNVSPAFVCDDPLLKIAHRALENTSREKIEKKHTQEETEKDTKIGKPIVSLTKADLTIPRFSFDKSLEKSYKTLFYFEHPDGRVVLHYIGGTLYTTIKKVLSIPYPIPKGYFKDSGLGANQSTGLRLYRQLLFTQKISENTRKNTANVPNCTAGAPGANPSVQEDPEDWKYRPILNTNTRPNRDEEKIEGALE